MFYNRLIELCEAEGIKPTVLLKNLGMSKGSLANWKEGKLPTGEILVRFSEHFGVSIDYLALGKENFQTPSFTKEDMEIISLFNRLPPEKKEVFKARLDSYVEACEDYSITTPRKQAK